MMEESEENIYSSIKSCHFGHQEALAVAELDQVLAEVEPSYFHSQNPFKHLESLALESYKATRDGGECHPVMDKSFQRTHKEKYHNEKLRKFHSLNSLHKADLSVGLNREQILPVPQADEEVGITDSIDIAIDDDTTYSFITSLPNNAKSITLHTESLDFLDSGTQSKHNDTQTLLSQKHQKRNSQRKRENIKLKRFEAQLEQLNKMVSQFNRLKKAKHIATDEAVKSLKNHTQQQIDIIISQEKVMLSRLNKQHEKDMEQIISTEKELKESLRLLADTISSVYKNEQFLNRCRESNKRDSGYWGSDTEGIECNSSTIVSDNAPDENTESKERTIQQVSTRLDDMLNQVPNMLWQQRRVIQFVCGNKPPSIGSIRECFISPDFNRVTKCRAVSFCDSLNKKPAQCALKRRALSELTLYNKGEELTYELSSLAIIESPLPSPEIKGSQPELMVNIHQKGSHPGGIHQPIDACFLPNGNLLLAELGNSRLQELTLSGLPVQVFDKVQNKPKGVIVTREGYIACTDEKSNSIKVFTRGGNLVCQFGTGYFKDPSSIDTLRENTYLVCDNEGPWQQYVYKYNAMTGEKTRIGYDKNSTYVVSRPEYVCVDHKYSGNILISDSAVHCIWVFDNDAKLQFRFGNKDSGDDNVKLSHPKGLCLDSEGNILVADCANHRVVKYNGLNGEFLSVVVDASHGINYPHVVQLNEKGKLVVVQDSSVLVFQI